MKKALQSVDERSSAIVDEWIRLVEIPAPSRKEQARAQYVRAEMQKLGLSDIRVDDMSNVSGVRKGSGGGPMVVFCAHTDTVFPEGTELKVRRDGDILRAPGVGDDTSNVIAVLEMFRALNRGGVQTKGDLVFLASVQEELGLLGAKHWLETSGYKPDMFIAVDVGANQVWYGALRISQYKFYYNSDGAHTMESRGGPNPAKAVAKAIAAVYDIPLPPVAEGLDSFKLPVANVGMIGGGTVVNAVAREAWFSVDLRSLDTPTQAKLEQAVEAAARHAAEQEGVAFHMEKSVLQDYSKARPKEERLESSAGADGARRQQSLPQGGHAGHRSRRRRVHRRQQRRRAGHSSRGHRRDAGAHAASPRRDGRSRQHRTRHQVADGARGGAHQPPGWQRASFARSKGQEAARRSRKRTASATRRCRTETRSPGTPIVSSSSPPNNAAMIDANVTSARERMGPLRTMRAPITTSSAIDPSRLPLVTLAEWMTAPMIPATASTTARHIDASPWTEAPAVPGQRPDGHCWYPHH